MNSARASNTSDDAQKAAAAILLLGFRSAVCTKKWVLQYESIDMI